MKKFIASILISICIVSFIISYSFAVDINDDYITKFKYNISDIKEYKVQFNGNMNNNNWSLEQRNTIDKLWRIKLGNPKRSIATRKNLYVSKNDDYVRQMNYDKDEILLYYNLFGVPQVNRTVNSLEDSKKVSIDLEKIKGIEIEWASVIKNGKHTAFYNRNVHSSGSNTRAFTYNENEGYYDANPTNQDDKELLKEYESIINNIEKLQLINEENYVKMNTSSNELSEIIDNIDDYGKIDTSNGTKLSEKAGVILGYIQLIGSILSVLVLIILGIKYMVGSVEQKAYFKESLKPYIIGVVILFAATSLPKFIYEIVNSIMK